MKISRRYWTPESALTTPPKFLNEAPVEDSGVLESRIRWRLYPASEPPYNEYVADDSCAVAVAPAEHIERDPVELAEHVRAKLNLAIKLACEAEQERRSCRWESAEVYQRQWEEAMAEVKRLLTLVRKSGVSVFAAKRMESPRSARVAAEPQRSWRKNL